MAGNVVVDASFLVALLGRRDVHRTWAVAQARRFPPPWKTCEAALSETCYLLGSHGAPALHALLRREAVTIAFELRDDVEAVLKLMERYADLPASLADACLVRMTEVLPNPILLTTDTDFRVYRRHGRQVVPAVFPS